jgi:hypothetical protein
LQDPYVANGIQREPVQIPVPKSHHKTYLDKTALWKFQGKKSQDIGDWLFTIVRYLKKMARVYGILSEETKIDIKRTSSHLNRRILQKKNYEI